jgi:hypothetical protein
MCIEETPKEKQRLERYISLVNKAQTRLNAKPTQLISKGLGKNDFFLTGSKFKVSQD